MAAPHSETIALQRAENGHDLWAAIEAAQFARIVEHDAPRGEIEAERTAALVEFFSDCAEAWEEKSAAEQTAALERLGRHLAALEDAGLFAHWAVIERAFDTAEGETVVLPVAVLAIARDAGPELSLAVPKPVGTD